jgi:hypothetical protein
MGTGLFGLILLAYARFLDTGFAATDSLPLVETSRLTGVADAARLFGEPVMAGTRFVVGEIVYRPFVSLTFGLDHVLWGMNPFGYHLTNLAVHLCAVLGVWLLARRLGLGWWSSLAGATLFALHPLVLASVPVIARRDSIMPVAAFTGAAVCVLAAEQARGRRRVTLEVGAGVLLGVALLSKESAFAAFVMLPMLVLAAALGRGESLRRACTRLRILVPFVGVAGVLFVVRWIILGGIGGIPDSPSLLAVDFDRYGQTIGAYTRDLLWPFAWVATSTREVWRRVALALLIGLAATVLWLPRKQAVIFGAGVVWIVGFGVFCTVLRIATVAWLAYFGLIGVSLLFAAGLEGAVERLTTTAGRSGWRGALTRGASLSLVAGLGVFAASSLWSSALFREYDQWHVAGETLARYSQALNACINSAPEATRVNLIGLPSSFDDGRAETSLLGVTLLQDWTIESALKLAFPERRFTIHVSSSGTLRASPETLQFDCALVPAGVELTTIYPPG